MPNRIIKESICTSDNLDRLNAEAENTFFRLIVNADDYGLMDARPRILKAKLFPLKANIEEDYIDSLMRQLEIAGLISLYTVNGRRYLKINNWNRHQKIRAKKPKYPFPDGQSADICKQMTANDSNCQQMQTDDSKCSRNPIQSNIESNPNPNPIPNDAKRGGIGYLRRYISELTPRQWQELTSMMDDLGPNADELLEFAVDEACDASPTARSWKYIRKVLSSLIESGFTTRAQAEDAKRRKRDDPASPPPERSESGQYYEEW